MEASIPTFEGIVDGYAVGFEEEFSPSVIDAELLHDGTGLSLDVEVVVDVVPVGREDIGGEEIALAEDANKNGVEAGTSSVVEGEGINPEILFCDEIVICTVLASEGMSGIPDDLSYIFVGGKTELNSGTFFDFEVLSEFSSKSSRIEEAEPDGIGDASFVIPEVKQVLSRGEAVEHGVAGQLLGIEEELKGCIKI